VLVDLCDHQAGGREARAEADHAKADQVRMARDEATMFDEMKALADRYAEMHADRGAAPSGAGTGARRIGKGAAAMVAADVWVNPAYLLIVQVISISEMRATMPLGPLNLALLRVPSPLRPRYLPVPPT
jgi:hypothetical protein